MDLVIVESPAKAGTINKYLGTNYKVLASYGHIRDLPEKNGSVDPDNDFTMVWENQGSSQKQLTEIANVLKKSDRLFLATDPDREGEAISWHVLEVMKKKGLLKGKEVKRVVFNAITKNAVLEAMANPRELDQDLVNAYLARRALDYLVGFTLSPVLWRKLPGARSAGRVQSVALRIICARETEIEQFKIQEYWSLSVDFQTPDHKLLPTKLTHLNGEKLNKFSLGVKNDAEKAKKSIEAGTFSVESVESKPGQRNPAPPFTTSTLQQEAARKLGFTAKQTMQVAQKLYEGFDINGEKTGLITYMRTDGQQVAPEAVTTIRQVIEKDFGKEYLPQKAREYKTNAANSQEAHEAIRPTSAERHPEMMLDLLDKDQARLYELIWKRTIASQMENARVERSVIEVWDESQQIKLRASGTVITFPSFLKLYEEGEDDAQKKEKDTKLPEVTKNMTLETQTILPRQHFTEPPPRYGEASLVKKMEELGIGRPSTYASVLSVLRDRDYVTMEKKRFLPQDKGRLVIAFLESFFERYVEYDFTANLENNLDKVSNGSLAYKDVLSEFWTTFHQSVETTMEIRNTQILDKMNEVLGPLIFKDMGNGENPKVCPKCSEGGLSLKTGKFGAFIGCTNYPDCNYTRPFAQNETTEDDIERELGLDPSSKLMMELKNGRFGAYIQLGTAKDMPEGEKPKRCGLPKGMNPADMDLNYALKLLSLPRIVGEHPETKENITADLGRYGPYLRHGKDSATLETVEDIFEIGINRAVTVLAEKKANPSKRSSSIIKELGKHPDDQKPVNAMEGRYGPYIKHGSINATIPKSESPEDISLERALELISERANKAGKKVKKKPAKAKKTAKKS